MAFDITNLLTYLLTISKTMRDRCMVSYRSVQKVDEKSTFRGQNASPVAKSNSLGRNVRLMLPTCCEVLCTGIAGRDTD